MILKTKTNADRHTTVATISAITYGAATDAVNAIGQRESATRSSSATYNAIDTTEEWKYDDKGQVVTADHSASVKNRSYDFDGIGNRLSATDHNGTTDYTPNALNQYTSIDPGTAFSPIHDDDGNLTDDGNHLYTWDAENRLVSVHQKSNSALIAEYRYDYMSRRIYKETTAAAPQGAGASLYHYEGWNLCAEYTATSISSTTTSSITALQRTYTWGPDLSGSMQGAGGVGGLLTIEEKSGPHTGKYFPLYDGNGNVTELIKSGGPTGTTLVAHYEYDPFGNLTQSDDSDGSGYNAVNPWQFSTKYHDQETGFSYYGYRYYDPVTGRWPSRDPIEEKGGINLYGMVGNNAVNWWDYLGLDAVELPVPDSGAMHVNKPGENGQNAGTIPPVKGGENVNLWGNKEADGFEDYVVSGCSDLHRYMFSHGRTRKQTSSIQDDSVDRIMIRSSPFGECEMREICRICKENCTVTVSVATASAALMKDMHDVMRKWAGGSLGSFRRGSFTYGKGENKRTGGYISFTLGKEDCPCEKQRKSEKRFRDRLLERVNEKLLENSKNEGIPPEKRH